MANSKREDEVTLVVVFDRDVSTISTTATTLVSGIRDMASRWVTKIVLLPAEGTARTLKTQPTVSCQTVVVPDKPIEPKSNR